MARHSGSRRSSRSGGSRRSSGGGRRSSGGGRRSSGGSRGGRGRGAPRGGNSNATAIGVGIVLLVGVIAIIVIAGGKDKKKPVEYHSEELTADSNINKDEGPKKPERAPPPKISQEIIDHAKEVVIQAQDEQAKADALYDEAMKARQDGDEETWQAKLDQARDHYINIRELWNTEIVGPIDGELPSDTDYDADEVANYWIGREAQKITKMIDKIGSINKQLRMK